jgi:hypothetical protein
VADPAPLPAAPTGPTYSNYGDEVGLAMQIGSLFALARNQIPDYTEMLADALNKITDTLSNLNQGWDSASQQDAQDINDRWQASWTAMFGTDKEPELGIINRIGNGIESAASNYDLAETSLTQLYQTYQQMVMDLLEGITPAASGGGADSGPPPIVEV